jgi:hypothetical protein
MKKRTIFTLSLLLITAATAAVVTITEPKPETGDDKIALLRKLVHNADRIAENVSGGGGGAFNIDALPAGTAITFDDFFVYSDGGTEKLMTPANLEAWIESLPLHFATIEADVVDAASIEVAGVAITASAAEINVLDGFSANDVPIADTGGIFTATDAEAALLELAKVPVNTKAGAYTIGTDDPRECYGGVITVTAAATIAGPATLVAGMSWTIKSYVAGAVVFNPDNADTVTLDGTALAAGDSITSTSALGDIAVFVAMSASAIDATTDSWTDTN